MESNISDTRSLLDASDSKKGTCWKRFRRSKLLVAFTLLLAFMSECTTATLVQSLAPTLIKANDFVEYKIYSDGNGTSRSGYTAGKRDNDTNNEMNTTSLSPSWKSYDPNRRLDNTTVIPFVVYSPISNASSKERGPIFCAMGTSSNALRCADVPRAVQVNQVDVTDNATSLTLPTVIYCEKGASLSHRCIREDLIMEEISATVGYINAVGPLTELVVNPFVGVICSKYGHRKPFFIGSFLQIAGSLLFMLNLNTPVLFVARILCGAAMITCSISGLVTASLVFKDASERGKVLMFTYASAYPLGALLSYLAGNVGFSFIGPRLPFMMLFVMSLVDALLRVIIDTKSYEDEMESGEDDNTSRMNDISSADQSVQDEATDSSDGTSSDINELTESSPVLKKRRQGGYISYLTNGYMLVTLLLAATHSYAFTCISATAPNWLTSVLHAEQWELGVVFGVASVVQLATNLILGILVKAHTTWLFLMLGCILLTLSLALYPLARSIWFTTAPECLLRMADSITLGILSNVISLVTEVDYDGETAKAFSLFSGAVTLGAIFGPFSGGLILQQIPLMVFYYIVGGFVFLSGFGTLYLKTLPVGR